MSTKAKEKSYADNDGNTYRIEQATNKMFVCVRTNAGGNRKGWKNVGVAERMKNQMTQKEMDSLSALILLHTQKVSDYTKAVPNVGMARKHNEWVELLKKVQTLLHGEAVTCDGCLREKCDKRNQEKCIVCLRWVNEQTELVDNFKRRAT